MNNTYQVCNIDYDNELNKRLQSRFFRQEIYNQILIFDPCVKISKVSGSE